MKNLWLLLGSLAVTCIAVVAVAFLFTKKANAPVAPVDSKVVLGQTKNSKGKEDAKVTIVEFSDLQCPACKAAQPLVDLITQTATESVRLVYRHYPLTTVHKNAYAASKVAEAAANQGKFWEMHDKLFETQSEWEEDADPTSKFDGYAKDLKLDVEKFKKDRVSPEVEARITADQTDANTLGVNATPTFYVNNVATDVNDLKSTVDALLAK
ncbi:MAG: thioredoxin domain-containing protein [Candidatus Woesebacteria bacterium]